MCPGLDAEVKIQKSAVAFSRVRKVESWPHPAKLNVLRPLENAFHRGSQGQPLCLGGTDQWVPKWTWGFSVNTQ